MNDEQDNPDISLDSVREVLSNITDNLEERTNILKQILELIEDRQTFIDAVQLILETVLKEHDKIIVIVELCMQLLSLRPKCIADEIKKQSFFRRMLLTLCQIEFEDRRTEVVLPHNPEERVLAKENRKKRRLGIILFIEELYLHRFITSSQVIMEMVSALLQDITEYKTQNDRDNIELTAQLVCNLVAACGKLLDEQAHFALDTAFNEIKKFQLDLALSARVRDLFHELIDLKANGWKVRFDNRTKTTSDSNNNNTGTQMNNSLPDLMAMEIKVNHHLIVIQDKLLYLLESGTDTSVEYMTELKNQRKLLQEQKTQIEALIIELKSSKAADDNSSVSSAFGSSNDCVVCFDGSVDSVLVPCGHLALCFSCATMVSKTSKKCPICRQAVDYTLKTFKVVE